VFGHLDCSRQYDAGILVGDTKVICQYAVCDFALPEFSSQGMGLGFKLIEIDKIGHKTTPFKRVK
jgi:hypothetical protein